MATLFKAQEYLKQFTDTEWEDKYGYSKESIGYFHANMGDKKDLDDDDWDGIFKVLGRIKNGEFGK